MKGENMPSVLICESEGKGLGDLQDAASSVKARCETLERQGYRVRHLKVTAIAKYEARLDDEDSQEKE